MMQAIPFLHQPSLQQYLDISIGGSGGLTLATTTSLPDSPSNIAFAGGLLFAATPNFSRVYIFSVSSGTLTALTGSPLVVTEGVGTVTVDPSAKYLYVTNPGNNTISAYSIQYASGSNQITLTVIPGHPSSLAQRHHDSDCCAVTSILDSNTTHLYVANSAAGNLACFRWDKWLADGYNRVLARREQTRAFWRLIP
jgi:DNA-binding beta-propeller fold protein YncE